MAEKKPGFFNNDNKSTTDSTPTPRKGFTKEYKPPLVPKNPDGVNTTVKSKTETNFVESTQQIQQKSDIRKTMRVPETQFFEFMALLDASEYSYVYELLGDMIDQRINSLDSNELRVYNSALESIKRTEEKKKQRKRQ